MLSIVKLREKPNLFPERKMFDVYRFLEQFIILETANNSKFGIF